MDRLRAPRYDLFKLLVAIVLVILLILMFLGGSATTPAATQAPANDSTSVPTQSVASPLPSVPTLSISPSATLPAESTPTPDAATIAPTLASTETPASTNAASTLVPTAGQSTSCNTRLPSRLSIGQRARVAQRLNLRTAPSIDAPVLLTNAVDTTVEIFGGPVCTPVGERAYLWWQVRLTDGAEGWSAETQLNEPAYLLQPIP